MPLPRCKNARSPLRNYNLFRSAWFTTLAALLNIAGARTILLALAFHYAPEKDDLIGDGLAVFTA